MHFITLCSFFLVSLWKLASRRPCTAPLHVRRAPNVLTRLKSARRDLHEAPHKVYVEPKPKNTRFDSRSMGKGGPARLWPEVSYTQKSRIARGDRWPNWFLSVGLATASTRRRAKAFSGGGSTWNVAFPRESWFFSFLDANLGSASTAREDTDEDAYIKRPPTRPTP